MSVLEWCELVERTPHNQLGQAYSKAYAVVVQEHSRKLQAQQQQEINTLAAKRAAVMARKESKRKMITGVNFGGNDTQPMPPMPPVGQSMVPYSKLIVARAYVYPLQKAV